jgi:hypothetical protein
MKQISYFLYLSRRYFFLLLISSPTLFSQALAIELAEVHSMPGRGPFNKTALEARKADSVLSTVLIEFEKHAADSKPAKDFKPTNPNARVVKGRVLIDANAAGNGATLFSDLVAIGLTGGSHHGSMVSGYLPLGAIRKMLALDSLRVASASLAMTHAGLVTSQGDETLRADVARSAYGVDGTGTRVGVISDSYNCLSGAVTDQQNNDLPSNVVVLDDSVCPSGTDEGRAMMQIVHDVAPGANLAFHTAFNGIADFANGIEELAAIGANVIVDDVIYFYEPMFQDGEIAQAVDSVVAGGTAYFSSAGNSGRNGYARPFDNSGEPLTVSGEYRGFLHDFDPDPGSVDWEQAITIPVDGTTIICYQWDQPWGNSTVDMDIHLITSPGALLSGIVASSQTNNNKDRGGSGQPAECLQFTNTPTINSLFGGPDYNILLVFYSSGPNQPGLDNPPPPGLTINQQYVLFKGTNAPGVTEYRTDNGTLYGHANAAGGAAVGAAFYDLSQDSPFVCGEGRLPVADSSGTIRLECFSSAGSIPVYFDTDGNRLTSPEDRGKPNIVAPDGGNTTFFGFDIVNDPDGTPYASDTDVSPNFFGTSAGAPHVAAVAALMLDAAPTLEPGDVQGILEDTAIDMGAPGSDSDSGSGFIQADNAVAAALGGSPENNPPVAATDSATTDEDTPLIINVLDNDSDPDGDILTISNVTQGANGTVETNNDETVTYTPNEDFNGTDSFEYTLSDGDLTDAATVSVIINPVNDAPTAFADSAITDANVPVDIHVLTNDTDPDNDVTYEPNPGFSGEDSFEYTASDGNLTDTAIVSVTVNSPQTPSCAILYSDKRSCQNDPSCTWVGNPKNGSCQGASPVCEDVESSCSDGVDNDCDGFVDSADAEDCPPLNCSAYDDLTTCKADTACRWSRKDSVCLAR